MKLPEYKVFALRYATVHRKRSENFIVQDPHDVDMPMDYFVWVVRNQERTFLVDTGFDRKAAEARKRDWLRCPIGALALLGMEPEQVSDVILTHMHYDHAGNVRLLPRATIHVQESEVHYCCGRHMKHGIFRHAYSADDVVDVVRGVHDNRVSFYTGNDTIAPGVELIHIGGHTQGLQAVRVHTARGWVMLASDATHYYANMEEESPFPIVFNVGDMLEGYAKLRRYADSPDHIIPGHDPQVMERYPRHGDPANEIVALHLPPK